MGIKNVHITLISCSVAIALFFGLWALGHDFQILGAVSLLCAAGLIVYGISFLKKVKSL